MHYRFGRTVSVPLPEPGFAPRSMIDQISGNLDRGLHTLVLLDLRPGEGRYLTAPEALRTLSERDPDHVVLRPESPVAVAARVGSDSAAGWYGPLGLLVDQEFGPPLHAIVILADLHFEEAAALERFRIR